MPIPMVITILPARCLLGKRRSIKPATMTSKHTVVGLRNCEIIFLIETTLYFLPIIMDESYPRSTLLI